MLAAAVLCAGCFKSKNVVTRVKPDGNMRLDGVTYALPRTVVQARIPFKSVAATPGQYERYAPCFFPKSIAEGRVRAEKTTFSMEPPTLSSTGEPDPDEHYIARIKGGYFENKTMELAFNNDGIITKGEAISENKAIDFAIKAGRATISALAAGITPARSESGSTGDKALDKVVREALVDICRSTVVADAASVAAGAAEAAAKAAAAKALASAKAAYEATKAAEKAAAAAAQNPALKPQADAAAAAARAAEAARIADEASATAADRAAKSAREGVKNAELEIAAAKSELQDQLDERGEAGRVPDASRQVQRPAESEPLCRAESNEKGSPEGKSPLLTKVIGCANEAKKHVEAVAAAVKPPAGAPETDANKASAELSKAVTEAAEGIKNAVDVVGNNTPHSDISNSTRARAFANEFEEAKKINERIVQLREKRDALTSGDSLPSNLSVDAIKLLIEQADASITKYERTYFLGNKDSDTWTGEFRYVPIKADPSGVNAVQTSPMLIAMTPGGLCHTVESIKQEIKIKPTFVAKNCPDPGFPDGLIKGGQGVYVRVSRLRDNDGFLNGMVRANAAEEQRGERGFYYRIPAAAIVTLFTSKTVPGDGFKPEAQSVAARENIKFAQLGVTASLPASSAGRKTQYTVEFNEATGAMKNFKLGSNALLEATLAEEAGGAITDIITASKARSAAREAEAKAAADEAAAAAATAAAAADPTNQKKKLLEDLLLDNAIDAELKKKADSQTPPEAPPETPPQP
jgi:hypothetical protein